MRELAQFGFPEGLIGHWVQELGTHLLPVQALAIERFNVLEGGRLVVASPTSSGKSFLAELAAVHAGLRGRHVLYLVPLRALAAERAEDMSRRYGAYGVRVAVTDSDHKEDDPRILSGEVEVTVAVYEKALSLALKEPTWLHGLDLVIADELQIIGDRDRGPEAEMLLTMAATRSPSSRLLALSAVVGNPWELASWLGARLLSDERRPVPLRKGVVYCGVFRYRADGGEEGEEPFPEVNGETWEAMLVQMVNACVAAGEQVMVFIPSRPKCREWAARLAEVVDCPPAEGVIDALMPLEVTSSRNLLMRTLRKGVAFHNGDLLAPERWAIEAGIRNEEVRVVVATTTLASGINTPARTVIITPWMWESSRTPAGYYRRPLPQSVFEAMAGRAGRRFKDEFGRAVLLAPSPFLRDSLWRYMEQNCEAVVSCLPEEPLEETVLRCLAAQVAGNGEEVQSWMARTLAGSKGWLSSELDREKVDRAIAVCRKEGLLEVSEGGKVFLTRMGRAVASAGVPRSVVGVVQGWTNHGTPPSTLEILLTACRMLPPMEIPVPLSGEEYRKGIYERQVREHGINPARGPTCAQIGSALVLNYEETRYAKLALALQGWVEGIPTSEIEQQYRISAGTLVRAAESISWVVQGMADAAEAAGATDALKRTLTDLASRLPFGVRTPGLALARLRVRGLGRDHIRRLVEEGFGDPHSLLEVPLDVLGRVIPKVIVRRLLAKVGSTPEPSHTSASLSEERLPAEDVPVLDLSDPGSVRYRGRVVHLTPMEYKLLVALARTPQQTVPYSRLCEELWGTEKFVERNQINYHKSRLLRKLREVSGGVDPPPIVTVTGIGLRLTLPPKNLTRVSGESRGEVAVAPLRTPRL